MIVAILSGKGGTGKTFIATNLAASYQPSQYIDCDVEEPNGFLSLQPNITFHETVNVLVPKVDPQKCNGCRVCVNFCRYHALAYINNELMIFPDLCHHCGGCSYLCPQKALTEIPYPIGFIEGGVNDGVKMFSGTLNPGEISGIPIMQSLMEHMDKDIPITFLDCPPGVACPVIECSESADYCLLVAEDSIFGLENFKLAYELTQKLHKPAGVVINKYNEKNSLILNYCEKENITVLATIPFDRLLARLLADSKVVIKESKKYALLFKSLYHKIEEEITK